MSESGKVSLPTPERIEEIKRENEELVKTLIRVPIPSLICTSGQISELLAALEEAQQQNATLLQTIHDANDEVSRMAGVCQKTKPERDRLRRDLKKAREDLEFADRNARASINRHLDNELSAIKLSANLSEELVKAQQTIARQREALEQIDKACRKRSFNDCGDLRAVVYDIAYAALGGETQP